jgi:hypothetical protein
VPVEGNPKQISLYRPADVGTGREIGAGSEDYSIAHVDLRDQLHDHLQALGILDGIQASSGQWR